MNKIANWFNSLFEFRKEEKTHFFEHARGIIESLAPLQYATWHISKKDAELFRKNGELPNTLYGYPIVIEEGFIQGEIDIEYIKYETPKVINFDE